MGCVGEGCLHLGIVVLPLSPRGRGGRGVRGKDGAPTGISR